MKSIAVSLSLAAFLIGVIPHFVIERIVDHKAFARAPRPDLIINPNSAFFGLAVCPCLFGHCP